MTVTQREKARLIVMGTHGLGLLGRILMGRVARRVVSACDVPMLLVKWGGSVVQWLAAGGHLAQCCLAAVF